MVLRELAAERRVAAAEARAAAAEAKLQELWHRVEAENRALAQYLHYQDLGVVCSSVQSLAASAQQAEEQRVVAAEARAVAAERRAAAAEDKLQEQEAER